MRASETHLAFYIHFTDFYMVERRKEEGKQQRSHRIMEIIQNVLK